MEMPAPTTVRAVEQKRTRRALQGRWQLGLRWVPLLVAFLGPRVVDLPPVGQGGEDELPARSPIDTKCAECAGGVSPKYTSHGTRGAGLPALGQPPRVSG